MAELPALPETVISDNGTEFSRKTFRELLQCYNIKQQFATPYSPQSNGLVEWVNQTNEHRCTPSECFTAITFVSVYPRIKNIINPDPIVS